MNTVIGTRDALVVIDAQKDFVNPSGALYVAGVAGEPSREMVIQNICKLDLLPFGYRVTSEDKHPTDHVEFEVFPPHCVEGTPGQKYVEELRSFHDACNDNIIKGDDRVLIAYSVATSTYFATHIGWLRMEGIQRVFLSGWAYTHCVGESAIAYATQGFEVYVVRDATRSVPPPYGDPQVMSRKLALYGVKEISTHEIL